MYKGQRQEEAWEIKAMEAQNQRIESEKGMEGNGVTKDLEPDYQILLYLQKEMSPVLRVMEYIEVS